jgi:predicted O-methyltransferase YrrM
MRDNEQSSGLNSLCKVIKEHLGDNLSIVEIGSYAGGSTSIILSNFPKSKINCVDIWEKYVEEGSVYDMDIQELELKEAEEVFNELCKNNINITKNKMSSNDYVKSIEDESIDFVYIDGNHQYTSVKEDIEKWYPKVKMGGFICGHDFYWTGVNKAIMEYFKKLPDYNFLDNSWCYIKKEAKMKISICIPYHNRRNVFLGTLKSIQNALFKEIDIEVNIVDDASDENERIDNITNLFPKLNINLFRYEKNDKWWKYPVIPYNKAISMATGDVVIIQHPECYHVGNILKHIYDNIKNNYYLIYGCYSVNENDTIGFLSHEILPIAHSQAVKNDDLDNSILNGWVLRDKCYNYCVALTKKDLLELGGFDEKYSYGHSFGGDDFMDRVSKKNMNIVKIFQPYVLHLYHQTHFEDTYNIDVARNKMLFDITTKQNYYYASNRFVDILFDINMNDGRINIKSNKNINDIVVEIPGIYHGSFNFGANIWYWIIPDNKAYLNGCQVDIYQNNKIIFGKYIN